jgi:hypothetical protein
MLPSWSLARARLARAVRDGQPPERVDSLRREYHAARLAQRITDALGADLPPTPEQRAELARMLLAEGGADAAA